MEDKPKSNWLLQLLGSVVLAPITVLANPGKALPGLVVGTGGGLALEYFFHPVEHVLNMFQ